MLEMCSCMECISTPSVHVSTLSSDTDRLSLSIMAAHSRRFSSLWNFRRPLKGLCFATTILAFLIGLGLGLLVSIYCLPLTSSSSAVSVSEVSARRTSEFVYSVSPSQFVVTAEPLTTTSDSVSVVLETSESRQKSVVPSLPLLSEQKLQGHPLSEPAIQNLIFGRPESNVQFVPPAARILSLHPPVQIESSLGKYFERPKSVVAEKSGGDSDLSLRHAQLLENGVYWSQHVENQLPHGFSDTDLQNWRHFVHNSSVTKMEEGCGRMQNRLLTLDESMRACCRYRQNADQIQGEIFSFYLSQLLSIRNVAPSALNVIRSTGRQWSHVKQQLDIVQWTDEKPVVLTQFLTNLIPAHIPVPFRDSKRSLHPSDLFNSIHPINITELAQWSDLIVFDYLTANLDRIVNNLFNLQWNPSMMDSPAHNLVMDPSTNLLIFLDNESGVLHGYRLLDKYEVYHRLMLDSLCIFRRSTANSIKRLFSQKSVGAELRQMFEQFEPVAIDYLPMLPERSIKILNRRIEIVHNQILKCESLYDTP